ncbi:Sec63 Brl domain-containing protein [Gaertneriomyces semiglobifer]|nr:Sec63 Brl domain-containing protein [Gaertneriomyces semiglobifer]
MSDRSASQSGRLPSMALKRTKPGSSNRALYLTPTESKHLQSEPDEDLYLNSASLKYHSMEPGLATPSSSTERAPGYRLHPNGLGSFRSLFKHTGSSDARPGFARHGSEEAPDFLSALEIHQPSPVPYAIQRTPPRFSGDIDADIAIEDHYATEPTLGPSDYTYSYLQSPLPSNRLHEKDQLAVPDFMHNPSFGQGEDFASEPAYARGLHSQFQRTMSSRISPQREQISYPKAVPLSGPFTGHSTQRAQPRYTGVADPTASGISLIPISSLPDKFRSLFPYHNFNAVQSQCFNIAFGSDKNLVVSAPTGAGKTCIMELAILHQLAQSNGENAKFVYMAPTKALCNERTKDWQQKFRMLGLTCNELTGDTDNLRIYEIQQSNIIVTTPEKWDSMTRRWRDYKNLMGLVRLIMIDECHTLSDPGRGATLEVVISRMKTVNSELKRERVGDPFFGSKIRFLAVSATVPNIDDIAAWLKEDNQPAEVKVFGDEFRPVKLRREVLGFFCQNNNYFQFEASLDHKLMEIIERFSNHKPTLVFCSTRKSASSAAEKLKTVAAELAQGGPGRPSHPFVKTRDRASRLENIKKRIGDRKLAELVGEGVAFHHGGLGLKDRHLIESSFLDGAISVICATSTLAVGVNLPAHLVIVKGTQAYVGARYAPYSELDLMQMLGRAGRPQFDDSGTAVIMTDMDSKKKYEDLVCGRHIIESNLHESLIEHLNAEVALGAIKSKNLAMEWLRSTFLYVRMKRNPSYYKLKNCSTAEGRLSAEHRLESICLRDMDLLFENQLIHVSQDQRFIESTEFGQAMAKYYIKYQTAVRVINVKRSSTVRDALELLCKAEEFTELRWHGEKGQLNAINKEPGLRFPLKGKITEIEQKVNILLQCALASIPFKESKVQSSLTMETSALLPQACRVARFMVAICHAKQDFVSLKSAINLSRCLEARTWENSPLILKQIESMGPQLARSLSKAGIYTFDKLEKTDPRHIEFTVGRNPPFGNKVLEWMGGLPRFKMKVLQFTDLSNPTEIELFVEISFENAASVRLHGKHGTHSAVFLAGTSDHVLVDFRRFTIPKLKEGQSFRIKFQLGNAQQRILCSVISENYVGLDIHQEVIPTVKPAHFRNIARSGHLDMEDEYESVIIDDDDLAALDVAAAMAPVKPPAAVIEEVKDDQESMPDAHELPATVTHGKGKGKGQHNCPVRVPGETDQPAPVFAEGFVACRHFCKDKSSCSHMCCKTGVPVKTAKKRKGSHHIRNGNWIENAVAESTQQELAPGRGNKRPKRYKVQGLPCEEVEVNVADDFDNSALSDFSPPAVGYGFIDKTSAGREPEGVAHPTSLSKKPLAPWETRMLVDLEAEDEGYLDHELIAPEEDGEFDGWLVPDDEPIVADGTQPPYHDLDDFASEVSRLKDRSFDNASAASSALELVEGGSEKPSRVARRLSRIESHDAAEHLHSEGPLPRSRFPSVSNVDQATDRDPFTLMEKTRQRRPVLSELDALNELHDKVCITRIGALPQEVLSQRDSYKRTGTDIGPVDVDNIIGFGDDASPCKMKAQRDAKAKLHSRSIFRAENLCNTDLSSNATPTMIKGDVSLGSQTLRLGLITDKSNPPKQRDNPLELVPSEDTDIRDASGNTKAEGVRESLGNWIKRLRVEDFVSDPYQNQSQAASASSSRKNAHASQPQLATSGSQVFQESISEGQASPSTAPVPLRHIVPPVIRPHPSDLSAEAQKEMDKVLGIFADLF